MAILKNTYNIINKVLNSNHSVLYEPSDSLFDTSIKLLNTNIIPLSDPASNLACFDCLLLNNWQNHAVNRWQTVSIHQLIDIVIFHELCPKQFKKEDRFLLQNNFKNTYKIFPTLDIYKSWQLCDDMKSFYVPYGIPEISLDDNLNNKTIDVLIINSKENADIINLFKVVKNNFTNTNMVVGSNLETTINSMKTAKVIIDTHNIYNILIGINYGAFTITGQKFDSSLQSTMFINNISDILSGIQNILSAIEFYQHKIKLDQIYIKQQYNLDNFLKTFTDIIHKIKQEPFVS